MRLIEFFQRIDELYTPDVTYLKKYLASGGDPEGVELDIGFANIYATEFYEWLENEVPQYMEVINQIMQKSFKTSDWGELSIKHGLDEVLMEIWWDIPEKIRIEFQNEGHGEEYLNDLMQNDPAFAPSTSFYSSPQLLSRQTWLVHFSDNAYDIASEGFKYGMDQMDRLGLTTYFKNTASDKSHGGYNFAFQAQSRDAINAAGERKYGKSAVMFTNAGVQAYHSGDEEYQVMFWGANVDPKSIILLSNEGDSWCVTPHPSKTFSRDCVYENNDYRIVVAWVMKNWRQYAKIITGW